MSKMYTKYGDFVNPPKSERKVDSLLFQGLEPTQQDGTIFIALTVTKGKLPFWLQIEFQNKMLLFEFPNKMLKSFITGS